MQKAMKLKKTTSSATHHLSRKQQKNQDDEEENWRDTITGARKTEQQAEGPCRNFGGNARFTLHVFLHSFVIDSSVCCKSVLNSKELNGSPCFVQHAHSEHGHGSVKHAESWDQTYLGRPHQLLGWPLLGRLLSDWPTMRRSSSINKEVVVSVRGVPTLVLVTRDSDMVPTHDVRRSRCEMLPTASMSRERRGKKINSLPAEHRKSEYTLRSLWGTETAQRQRTNFKSSRSSSSNPSTVCAH